MHSILNFCPNDSFCIDHAGLLSCKNVSSQSWDCKTRPKFQALGSFWVCWQKRFHQLTTASAQDCKCIEQYLPAVAPRDREESRVCLDRRAREESQGIRLIRATAGTKERRDSLEIQVHLPLFIYVLNKSKKTSSCKEATSFLLKARAMKSHSHCNGNSLAQFGKILTTPKTQSKDYEKVCTGMGTHIKTRGSTDFQR